MIDLGWVEPGSTVPIPFQTYSSDDPSASITITGLATTDIEVYKGTSMTQRASDSGYALIDTDGIDIDTTTGIHGVSIDLSDNTTAGFYAAGEFYWVVIASITVDAATINFIPVRFRIGYGGALLNTTIATLASQTSFTLTTGSADDDAYNGSTIVIHDVASGVQIAQGVVSDYTGSTKTVTLRSDPGIFTMAATDNVAIYPRLPMSEAALANLETAATNYSATRGLSGTALPAAAADDAGGLPISDAGGLDMDGIKSDTAAILVDTAEIGAAGAGLTEAGGTGDHLTALATAANLATVDTVVDAILALLDDARGEPAQGAPPVNPDLATKIDYLYKAWRNKKDNDGSTTNLYADDGTTVDHKQTTTASGGTVTKGEWTTGP